MPWIDAGEWGFDTDHVTAVHRHPAPAGTTGEGARTVTDVYLDSGAVITLEAHEAAEFLDRWASPPGESRRAPLGRSYAIDVRFFVDRVSSTGTRTRDAS
jgi:hypothetical protein